MIKSLINILNDIKRNRKVLIISLLLFALSASFNAVMDTINHHYAISIFSDYDEQWWNPAVSWKNKNNYEFPWNITQISDAWHFFKLLMLASIMYNAIFAVRRIPITFGRIIVYTILYGLAWNLSFNLFYDYIFLK